MYWRISLGLPLGSNSVFWGTAVTNGSIALLSGAFLTGRGLTQASRLTIFQAVIGAATDALLGPGQNVSPRHDASHAGPGGGGAGGLYPNGQCYGFRMNNAGNIRPRPTTCR